MEDLDMVFPTCPVCDADMVPAKFETPFIVFECVNAEDPGSKEQHEMFYEEAQDRLTAGEMN